MSWSKETMDALHTWLVPCTAYEGHQVDDVRYFLFIGHVWRDCHSLWDEAFARDQIKHKAKDLHSELGDEFLENFAEESSSKGTGILNFLCELKNEGKLNELIPVEAV